jgi:hypothetical protein
MIEAPETTQTMVRAELEKILSARILRGKETLRVLLTYLVEKTLDGGAGMLKEYTIGVEAFGKRADYDPQEDASVRVQIGRLRQKLEEYYRTEGARDPLVIELPKRRFELLFHERPAEVAAVSPDEVTDRIEATVVPVSPAPARVISWPSLLLGALGVVLLWAGWSFLGPRGGARSPVSAVETSAELKDLWRPFLTSDRPITMAMTMRPFLRYDRGVVFDWGLRSLADEEREERLRELQLQLKTERLVPWEKIYTSFGEATGVFLLTRFFERYQRSLQLRRHDALTWEEIAEQNVIFIGSGKTGVPFHSIPVQLAFHQREHVILNTNPKEGELAEFVTQPPQPDDYMQEEDYALISAVPSLHGRGEIIAFGGSSSSALWAAVEFMTEPRYARELVAKLKNSDGQLPRHYQVVIHARFQALVPVEIKYVTHRVL